ncbi:MAG: hypothetical protein R3B84_15895 [Zavarzinella sp.]
MQFRLVLSIMTMLACVPGLVAQSESPFYPTPKTVPEFWSAVQFEIRLGNYERAAERLNSLLALEPDDKTLMDLLKPRPDSKDEGIAPFLRLRNIPTWNKDVRKNKEAKDQVETLIGKLTTAMKNELTNPVRIRKYVNNLAASPEEAAFALNELRKSGTAIMPEVVKILKERTNPAVHSALLQALPELAIETTGGLVLLLSQADAKLQSELIDVLQTRSNPRELTTNATTDPIPTYWKLLGDANTTDTVRAKVRATLEKLFTVDLDRQPDPALRKPQGQLNAIANRFHNDKANLRVLGGDEKNEKVHTVWVPDGEAVKETLLSRREALTYYALRYARWALAQQSDFVEAQTTFLTVAIEQQALLQPGTPLADAAPQLQAILSGASFAFLQDFMHSAIRDKRTAVVLSLVRTLGDRAEIKAAQPEARAGSEFRPALLVQAMDYPDPRVQFAATEALLKMPGSPVHLNTDRVVKVLSETLLAGIRGAGTPQALLGDPDPVRAQAIVNSLRQIGYRTEIAPTGRELMRRLRLKADIDLVLIDHHLPDPMLVDMLAQIRADRRGKALPVLVIASPEGVTPISTMTSLGRLALIVSMLDLPENPSFYGDIAQLTRDQTQRASEDEQKKMLLARHQAQVAYITKQVEDAGFQLSQELNAKIAYVSYLTLPFHPGQNLEKSLTTNTLVSLYERELLILQTLIPADLRRGFSLYPIDPAREIVGVDEVPIQTWRMRIPEETAPSELQRRRLSNLLTTIAEHELKLSAELNPQVESNWKIVQERLPVNAALRNPDLETRLEKRTRFYHNVRVIPGVFSSITIQEQINQVVDPKAPILSPEEKDMMALKALSWLRKIAIGQVKGYDIKPAEGVLRRALLEETMVVAAIEAVERITSKEVQQDLLNVVISVARPEPVRMLAADATIRHIQANGVNVGKQQIQSIIDLAADEKGPLLAKINSLKGILTPDAATTGNLLQQYQPVAPKPVPMPMPMPKDPE